MGSRGGRSVRAVTDVRTLPLMSSGIRKRRGREEDIGLLLGRIVNSRSHLVRCLEETLFLVVLIDVLLEGVGDLLEHVLDVLSIHIDFLLSQNLANHILLITKKRKAILVHQNSICQAAHSRDSCLLTDTMQ